MAGMAQLGSPLSTRDLSELNKSLYLLNQLVPLLDQAEQAGIDVSNIRSRRDELYTQASLLKQTYFPSSE